jgi:hypothetical protein
VTRLTRVVSLATLARNGQQGSREFSRLWYVACRIGLRARMGS